MNDLENNLPDTRKTTLLDEQPNNIWCEAKMNKAVSAAIYKIFPKDLENVKKTLEQYNKAIKSNVLTRFDYFDFENLDIKMKIIEEIDREVKSLTYLVKQLIEKIEFEKNNIKIDAEKWIDKIENQGIRNIKAGQVMFNKISDLETKLIDIEKNKTNIFSLTNILLVAVAGATAINTYHLFFKGQI